MVKKFRFVGHPFVDLKSLNRRIQHGEILEIREEDITPEIRGLIKMGLFEQISKRVFNAPFSRGTDFFRRVLNRNDRSGNTAQKQEQASSESPLPNEALLSAIRNIVREEVGQAPLSGVSSRGVSPSSGSKAPLEKVSSVDTTLFIRPDEKEIKGSIEVSSQAEESGDVNDAINKLKKKGGKKK